MKSLIITETNLRSIDSWLKNSELRGKDCVSRQVDLGIFMRVRLKVKTEVQSDLNLREIVLFTYSQVDRYAFLQR